MASTQNADATGPVRSRDIELGRELGNRPVPTHVARLQRPNAEPELLIATRIDRAGPLSVDEAMDLSRVARLLSRNPHPNLTRVRDVVVRDTDMLVVETFIDGQSLAELWRTARSKGSPLPLAVSLRIMLDVLSGLEALHSTRLAAGQPAGLVHGELTPGNVIVGQDGIARLIHTCRVASAWSQVPEAARYMAPEILMRERELDARVDLYSVGALLWEAIAGKPAIEATSAAAVVKYLARGPLPSPAIGRNAVWATPVVSVAMRALSADRDARFEHAGTMRDELLKDVRARIAPPEDVARWVRQLAGTLIQERRKRFANEAQARLSIDVELSSPGIPIPARPVVSVPGEPSTTNTRPAPAMVEEPEAELMAEEDVAPVPLPARRPPPPAIASKPPMPAPVVAPPAAPMPAPVVTPLAAPKPATPPPGPAVVSSAAVVVPPAVLADEPVPPAPASPAMTPAEVELPGLVPASPDSPPAEEKRRKKAVWIAAVLCVVAGVSLGTWLGLRWIRGSAPESSASATSASAPATVVRTAEPASAAALPAEPPATAKPQEPVPEEANAGATPEQGAPTGQNPPIARATPAGNAAAPTAEPAAEPSQAAPAATPEPIPGPPPRPAKRDTEPKRTKGKYQPLGI